MSAVRRATSLSLDRGLVAGAKPHGINLSRAAAAEVPAALTQAKAETWRSENAETNAGTEA